MMIKRRLTAAALLAASGAKLPQATPDPRRFQPPSYPEKYLRPCITDLLLSAPTLDALQELKMQAETKLTGASASTRRKWKKAFDARHDQLKTQTIILPPGVTA